MIRLKTIENTFYTIQFRYFLVYSFGRVGFESMYSGSDVNFSMYSTLSVQKNDTSIEKCTFHSDFRIFHYTVFFLAKVKWHEIYYIFDMLLSSIYGDFYIIQHILQRDVSIILFHIFYFNSMRVCFNFDFRM